MKELRIKIGKHLKEKRINKGLSLSQAGELINHVKSTIFYYETGRNGIDIDTLNKLCRAYGVDMFDFLDEVRNDK